jgi:hypothetical protein
MLDIKKHTKTLLITFSFILSFSVLSEKSTLSHSKTLLRQSSNDNLKSEIVSQTSHKPYVANNDRLLAIAPLLKSISKQENFVSTVEHWLKRQLKRKAPIKDIKSAFSENYSKEYKSLTSEYSLAKKNLTKNKVSEPETVIFRQLLLLKRFAKLDKSLEGELFKKL